MLSACMIHKHSDATTNYKLILKYSLSWHKNPLNLILLLHTTYNRLEHLLVLLLGSQYTCVR
jgi:hypothetical protein